MKLYEVASQDSYIHDEMEKLGISPKLYIIRNGMVDVEGDVKIPNHYTSIPVPFRSVSGDFNCYRGKITSLKNSPREVGEDFLCHNAMNITSLEGAPIEVGGTFACNYTNITSLKGAPREVGEDFFCNKTLITSLEGAPREVGEDFCCNHTNITSLEGAPRKVGGDFYCHGIFDNEPDRSFIKIGGTFRWTKAPPRD